MQETIFSFELFVDDSILKNKEIVFNAGSLRDFVIISIEDYLRIAKSHIFNFANKNI